MSSFRYSQHSAEYYVNAKLVIVPKDIHCFNLHLEMMTEAVNDFLTELD